MRKALLASVAIVVLFAAVVAAFLWHRRALKPAGVSEPGGSPNVASASPDEEPPPPLPAISLQVNRQHELVAYQGTPLIFSVRLANPRAMNAASENRANQAYATRIEAALKRGEKPGNFSGEHAARLRQLLAVRSVEFGDQTTGWEQFIHFLQLIPDGKPTALPWKLRLLASPKEKTLTLDATVTAQLDYALEPEVAAEIGPGDYQILAVIDVPQEASLQPARWLGKVESEPDKLTIKEKPARLESAEQEKLELDLAGYFSTIGDPASALDHAQKALALDPHSIHALALAGESKEAQGDLKGALTAFQTATGEFYRQHPDSYEAPLYLIGKTEDILEKLPLRP